MPQMLKFNILARSLQCQLRVAHAPVDVVRTVVVAQQKADMDHGHTAPRLGMR
jgi:hypothetical protein